MVMPVFVLPSIYLLGSYTTYANFPRKSSFGAVRIAAGSISGTHCFSAFQLGICGTGIQVQFDQKNAWGITKFSGIKRNKISGYSCQLANLPDRFPYR
jgi:hypothetical protein